MSKSNDPNLWSASLDVQRYWSPVEGPIPASIWEKIQDHHIEPLRDLYRRTGAMFFPSLRSGYRPKAYELAKGRSGSSHHTFPGFSRGAVDLVMWNGEHVRHYVDLIVEYGKWRRIVLYSGKAFVHVDYGERPDLAHCRRRLFEGLGPDGVWKLRSYLAEPRV